jgi:hypothetical protein
VIGPALERIDSESLRVADPALTLVPVRSTRRKGPAPQPAAMTKLLPAQSRLLKKTPDLVADALRLALLDIRSALETIQAAYQLIEAYSCARHDGLVKKQDKARRRHRQSAKLPKRL